MTNSTPQPETPMLERMNEVRAESQIIGNFLTESGYVLGQYDGSDDDFHRPLVQTHKSTEQILADYFEIDLNQVEKERRALIEWMTSQNYFK